MSQSSTAFPPRFSILNRPVRSSSVTSNNGDNTNSLLLSNTQRHNAENAQLEYEREQRRLEAKRQRYHQLHENRRVSLWGGGDEKKRSQEQRRVECQEQLSKREENRKKEMVHDFMIAQETKLQESERRMLEQNREMQKKQYLRDVMLENQRLVELKRQQQENERRREKEQERSQVDFFDRYRTYR